MSEFGLCFVNSQNLHSTEDANTMVGSENWEKVHEEGLWPAELGEDKDNALADNEQSAQDSEEHTGWLEWDGRAVDVIAVELELIAGSVCQGASRDIRTTSDRIDVTKVN